MEFSQQTAHPRMACWQHARNFLIVLLFHLSFIFPTRAYPELLGFSFPSGCAHNPDASDQALWGNHHAGPVLTNDPFTALSLTLGDENIATQAICPGAAHAVQVQFFQPGGLGTPQQRRALLTMSQGTFAEASGVNAISDRRCENRAFLAQERKPIASQYTMGFSVSCEARGQVVITVSSSECDLDDCGAAASQMRQVTLTANIDPSCSSRQCPLIVLPPPAPLAPGQDAEPFARMPLPPQEAAYQLPPPSPLRPPAPAAPQPPPPMPEYAEDAVGTGCAQPSSLGYDCSFNIADKITLHWSTKAQPPRNVCTGFKNRTFSPASASTNLTDASIMEPVVVHIAAVARVAGYVSIGFPQSPGTMYPGDLMLGWIQDDVPFAATFEVTDFDVFADDAKTTQTWASNMGVARLQDGAATSTVICFSRNLQEPLARFSQNLDITSLSYEWAIHDRPNLLQHKPGDYGSGIVNLRSGANAEIAVKDITWAIDVHGAMMMVAWLLFSPLGVLVSVHRWSFGGRSLCGKDLWFQLHITFQAAAAAAFFVGLVIAFTQFPDPTGDLLNGHAILGYAVIGLCGLQVLLGLLRPKPDAGARRLWSASHSNAGKATILVAWAATSTGIAAYHSSAYSTHLVSWVVPSVVVVSVLVAADTLLKAMKPAACRYVPSTLLASVSVLPGTVDQEQKADNVHGSPVKHCCSTVLFPKESPAGIISNSRSGNLSAVSDSEMHK